MTLSRESIQAKKPKPSAERIEALDGDVMIRQMSAGARAKVLSAFRKAGDDQEKLLWVSAELVRLCVVDDADEKVFETADEVLDHDEDVVEELIRTVMKVNKMGAGDVEDDAKN